MVIPSKRWTSDLLMTHDYFHQLPNTCCMVPKLGFARPSSLGMPNMILETKAKNAITPNYNCTPPRCVSARIRKHCKHDTKHHPHVSRLNNKQRATNKLQSILKPIWAVNRNLQTPSDKIDVWKVAEKSSDKSNQKQWKESCKSTNYNFQTFWTRQKWETKNICQPT